MIRALICLLNFINVITLNNLIKKSLGNAKFRSHDNEGAIRIYTESIIIAPEYGPELCLGYGNRSAALYHAGQYQGNIDSVPPRIWQLITVPSLHRYLYISYHSRFFVRVGHEITYGYA